jgi:hypothetical protein
VHASLRRLVVALLVLVSLVAVGATGFWALGHGKWTFDECVYMTVITLSTVGFGELSQMHEVPGARPLTIALIVSGVGALAYVQGNLTALLVEGVIGQGCGGIACVRPSRRSSATSSWPARGRPGST